MREGRSSLEHVCRRDRQGVVNVVSTSLHTDKRFQAASTYSGGPSQRQYPRLPWCLPSSPALPHATPCHTELQSTLYSSDNFEAGGVGVRTTHRLAGGADGSRIGDLFLSRYGVCRVFDRGVVAHVCIHLSVYVSVCTFCCVCDSTQVSVHECVRRRRTEQHR